MVKDWAVWCKSLLVEKEGVLDESVEKELLYDYIHRKGILE